MPAGANGRFDFAVALAKGDSRLTAEPLSGKITATGWAASSFTVTIDPPVNGTVAAVPSNPVTPGATVTLTLASDAGYVLNTLSVYKTGDPGIAFALSVTGATTRTFTMPGCDVTVTATFSPTAGQLAVEAAASLIPATFTVAQATANTQTDVKNWLAQQINDLIVSTGVAASASDIALSGFMAATVGTAGSPSGTNGAFSFTVTLAKNGATLTTPAKNGAITATLYTPSPYAITVVPAINGTVMVAPANPVYAGAAITLTLTPSAGYGLASVKIYRTDVPSTTITPGGSGATRTFAMPAFDVTVEATFLPASQLAAQQDVNNARSLIENAAFSVSQATANTQTDVKNWLARQINDLIASTGVAVSASDMTIGSFAAAIAGTASQPSGVNGSFTFAVSLAKDNASAATSVKTGRIVATGYEPPVRYAITIEASPNGRVQANVASAPAGDAVTLTITPEAGYELDVISAYATSAASATVALSGSGATRTFIMPAYAVTVTATFRKTQEQLDREIVEAVKISVEGGAYRIAQATGNTEAAVKSWLVNVLNLLLSGRNAAVTIRSAGESVLAADATLTSFTPAIGGTEATPDGANGSFRFTVMLAKGAVRVRTLEVNGVVVATPYAVMPVKRIELLSLGDTRIRIINTGNAETGNLTASLSGANAGAFTLLSTALGSLPVGGEADFMLIPREGLAAGVYTVTATVGGEGLTPVSLEIAYRVTSTANESVAGRRVWAAGATLYIVAATAGEARVFDAGGLLVKTLPHTAGEIVRTTLPQGFYVVVAEETAHKVMIR
jgi:hypothetical protein